MPWNIRAISMSMRLAFHGHLYMNPASSAPQLTPIQNRCYRHLMLPPAPTGPCTYAAETWSGWMSEKKQLGGSLGTREEDSISPTSRHLHGHKIAADTGEDACSLLMELPTTFHTDATGCSKCRQSINIAVVTAHAFMQHTWFACSAMRLHICDPRSIRARHARAFPPAKPGTLSALGLDQTPVTLYSDFPLHRSINETGKIRTAQLCS